MPDITSNKFFVPGVTVVAMIIFCITTTAIIAWRLGEVKSDLSIQIATFGQELKDHIKYTSNSITQK